MSKNEKAEERAPEVKSDGVKLPAFIEASMAMTRIVLVVLVPATMIISLAMGCVWYIVILRGMVAGVVVGGLGWLLNWMLGRFLIEASVAELKALGVSVNETPNLDFKA